MYQPRLAYIVIFISIIFFSHVVKSERYLVVDDGKGGVSAVKEPEKAQAGDGGDVKTAPELSDDLRQVRTDVVPEVVAPSVAGADATIETIEAEKELSVFERRYLETERAQEKQALEKILNAEKTEEPPRDINSIRESDYVDADELLLEEARQAKDRYFVYIDADGQRRVQYINPELDREAMRQHAESLMPEVSEATVIMNKAAQGQVEESTGFPEGADPVAVAILSRSSDEKDFFATFSENCCVDLPDVRRWDISQDRSYLLEISEEDPRYRFSEGVSRFLILELPKFNEDYRLLIRSFIKKFGEDSLQRGVFLPQVVTLDQDLVPIRVFTGPVLKYVPESWYKHGYLEGVFEIKGGLEERYVLLNTTPELVREVSTIEDEELGRFQLEHQKVGTFEVQALLPFRY